MIHNALMHYYGDQVRILFVIGGLIMIITYPFFNPLIGIPAPLAIIGFASLAIFGGFMNPKQKWVIKASSIISVLAFVIFEYVAVNAYLKLSPTKNINIAFFWINQVLALIFFFAAYLSTKTLRGMLVAEKEEKSQ